MSLRRALPVVLDLLKEQLSIVASGAPVASIGDAFELATECFEAVGICHYLAHADRERLHRHLTFAGYARRYFLRRAAVEAGPPTPQQARSRWNAWFAALAAGDADLALAIGAAERDVHTKDAEYEDDFAHALAVDRLLRDAPAPAVVPALDQLARTLGAPPGPERLAVDRALLVRDPAAFGAAFDALLEARADDVAAKRRFFVDDPTFEPRARLYVEGMALWRLAERRGLVTPADRRDRPLLPAESLDNPRNEPPHDLFLDIEAMI